MSIILSASRKTESFFRVFSEEIWPLPLKKENLEFRGKSGLILTRKKTMIPPFDRFLGLNGRMKLTMDFLFRKGIALAGVRSNPEERDRLFKRFGGGDDLRDLCARIEKASKEVSFQAPDPFDTSFPDPNLIAGFFDEPSEKSQFQRRYEDACLHDDSLLAEAASVSEILRLFQEESTTAPKSCRQRAYRAGEESSASAPVSEEPRVTKRPSSSSAYSKPRSAEELFADLSAFEVSDSKISESSSRKSAFSFMRRSREESPSQAVPPPDRVQTKGIRDAEPAVSRRSPQVSVQSNRRRPHVLPFICAVAVAALLFHFRPFLQSVSRPVSEPRPAHREPAPEQPVTEEPIQTDSLEFTEAPVSEKIATPPEPSLEFSEASVPEHARVDFGSLSLLSDTEKAAVSTATLKFRPYHRGRKGEVMTFIPGE